MICREKNRSDGANTTWVEEKTVIGKTGADKGKREIIHPKVWIGEVYKG